MTRSFVHSSERPQIATHKPGRLYVALPVIRILSVRTPAGDRIAIRGDWRCVRASGVSSCARPVTASVGCSIRHHRHAAQHRYERKPCRYTGSING